MVAYPSFEWKNSLADAFCIYMGIRSRYWYASSQIPHKFAGHDRNGVIVGNLGLARFLSNMPKLSVSWSW